jgi:hypothetical protein
MERASVISDQKVEYAVSPQDRDVLYGQSCFVLFDKCAIHIIGVHAYLLIDASDRYVISPKANFFYPIAAIAAGLHNTAPVEGAAVVNRLQALGNARDGEMFECRRRWVMPKASFHGMPFVLDAISKAVPEL